MDAKRTLALVAVPVAAALIGAAATPAAAAPKDSGRRMIRVHTCTPGAQFGGGIIGWLVDDHDTRRIDYRWLPIENADQTWRFTITHSCRTR